MPKFKEKQTWTFAGRPNPSWQRNESLMGILNKIEQILNNTQNYIIWSTCVCTTRAILRTTLYGRPVCVPHVQYSELHYMVDLCVYHTYNTQNYIIWSTCVCTTRTILHSSQDTIPKAAEGGPNLRRSPNFVCFCLYYTVHQF